MVQSAGRQTNKNDSVSLTTNLAYHRADFLFQQPASVAATRSNLQGPSDLKYCSTINCSQKCRTVGEQAACCPLSCTSRRSVVYVLMGTSVTHCGDSSHPPSSAYNGGTGCLLPQCTAKSDLHVGQGIPLLQPGLKLALFSIRPWNILPCTFQLTLPRSSLSLSSLNSRLVLHIRKVKRVQDSQNFVVQCLPALLSRVRSLRGSRWHLQRTPLSIALIPC